MRTLLLLRHAKSSWDNPSLRDFDRPLSPRGYRDAPRIGKELKRRGQMPDLVLSSPATRARQTIEAVLDAAGADITPQFDESIYAASSAELMRLVRRLPDQHSVVMLVGHNPGFEDLLSRLTGSYEHMPTASLACIELKSDRWDDAQEGQGKLASLIIGKQLKRSSKGKEGQS